MTPFVSVSIFTLVLGAIVGSFLNVCIYRIPAGLSIVHPPSRCPHCEAPIRWYQNIPLLSWIVLRGRCAHCKTPVSYRYPLIEALCGGLYLLVALYFGLSWSTLVFWLFFSLLLVITFIDLDHQIIPNVISLPGIVVGFACSLFLLPLAWQDSALGVLLGGGFLWTVATGYRLLMGVEGMGMGDVKLLAMIGAFLGWQAVLPVVFLGSIVGTAVGVPYMLIKGEGGKLAIPFGPFLSLGAILYVFCWSQLFNWYVVTFF
jgi:leader peptidase (prepilin peptidase)/N-methyltransferase